MKSEKLQRQKNRAEKVANKLGTLENIISENTGSVKDLKTKYDEYANIVLVNRLENTKDLVDETSDLMKNINQSIIDMVQKLQDVENDH